MDTCGNVSKMNRKKSVSNYLENLAQKGQYFFTLEDLVKELGLKKNSISKSLSRLSKIQKIKMIRKGFGIYTGHTASVLDPSYFLNAMMSYLDAKYYVALLNAAAYKGASHQAVMSFTVVADKVIKPINLGKLIIDFVTKNQFDEMNELEKVAGLGGYYNISSPELTIVDLVRFPKKSGGLSNVATVISELIEGTSINKFKKIIVKENTPTTALQRLGYIFDVILEEKKFAKLIEEELKNRRAQVVPLSVSNGENTKDCRIDTKWNLRINTKVEPDE